MTNNVLTSLTFSDRRDAILALLRKELTHYLSGSSSLPVEEVESLLQSLLFVLSHSAPHDSLETQLTEGKKQLSKQLAVTRELYQLVLDTMLPLEVDAYRQTIDAIGHFFTDYDYDYHAHEVPVYIDYWLALPVDDLCHQGLDFIDRYLQHLAIENYFCSFYIDDLADLFDSYEQQLKVNYRHDINNLFKVVFKQALAKQLIHSTKPGLILSPLESSQIALLLKDTADIHGQLTLNLDQLLANRGITDSSYYRACLTDIHVELTGLQHGSLKSYFLVSSKERDIFISHPGLDNQQFTRIIGELAQIDSWRLPLFLSEQFASITDYLDLFALEILAEVDLKEIITSFDPHSLAVLLRFASRQVDEPFSSFSETLHALTTGETWHHLLAEVCETSPHPHLIDLFEALTLVDDFD